MAIMDPFVWGRGGSKLTPEQIAKQREIEEELMRGAIDTSPVGHWSQGLARVANAAAGSFRRGRLDRQQAESDAYNAQKMGEITGLLANSSSSAGAMPQPVVQSEMTGGNPVATAGAMPSDNRIYNEFIDTVKAGGVDNPYALAAIAATGRAESGFDPAKANARWADPSQSGQPGTSGGILSWRNERLSGLEQFAAANGEDPSNISAATQAKYLLQEDPALIESLKGAKSVEEAQSMMNNAWKFAGYDQPSKESARRLGYAREYASQFQPTAGVEVASLDPAAGMPTAGQGNSEWLRYSNDKATRSLPISEKLQGALSFLPELGVQMEVFSGGQPGKEEGGARTGSTRHDHGEAADVFFYKDGRKLDWNNPEDVPLFQEIVRRGKAAGITGFGAGPGYMQQGSMHLGFGTPAVWGAGGKGANAAEWLRTAYADAGQPSGGKQAIANIMTNDAAIPDDQRQQIQPIVNELLPPEFRQSTQLQNASGGMMPVLMGGTPADPTQIAQAGQQQQQIGRQRLLQALTDPRANSETRKMAGILLQQEMDKDKALQEQRVWMQQQDYQQRLKERERQEQYAREDSRNSVLDKRYENEQAYNKEKDRLSTYRVLSPDEKVKFGLPEQGAFQMDGSGKVYQIGNGGTTVNVDTGTIPAGFRAVRDANGRIESIEPLPGSPAFAEAEKINSAKTAKDKNQLQRSDLVSQEIDRALDVMKGGVLPDTGWGDSLSWIPGTDAKRLSGLLGTVKANIGFNELNKMRQESPTGGALGNVTEKELAALQAVAGSLDQSQDTQTLTDNLNRLWNAYQDTIHGVGNGPERRKLSFEAKEPVKVEGYTIEEEN